MTTSQNHTSACSTDQRSGWARKTSAMKRMAIASHNAVVSALSILTSARQYITAGLVGLGALLALLVVLASVYVQVLAQNAGAPAPMVPQQFLDSEGNPLVSGTVATYITATGTSAITFSDAALNSRNANPVVLNSAGRASIYLYTTQVYRFIVSDSSNVQIYSQDGISSAAYIAEQQALDIATCDGRMTLTSGVPVTTVGVDRATTIFYTPYVGNRCAVFDGTDWRHYTFSELSLALGTDASATNYDLFIYATNGGTLALERLAWANNLDRTTNLTRQNGVLVKSGDATRRYLGTYRTAFTTGQTEDSVQRRFVWNFYHRVPRLMRVLEDTNSWNYSVANFRQANNSSANMLQFVTGDTSLVEARILAHVNRTDTEAGGVVYLAIGAGTSSTPITNSFIATYSHTQSQTAFGLTVSDYARVGFETWVWLERTNGAGTTAWYGDDGATGLVRSGIIGWVEM